MGPRLMIMQQTMAMVPNRASALMMGSVCMHKTESPSSYVSGQPVTELHAIAATSMNAEPSDNTLLLTITIPQSRCLCWQNVLTATLAATFHQDPSWTASLQDALASKMHISRKLSAPA